MGIPVGIFPVGIPVGIFPVGIPVGISRASSGGGDRGRLCAVLALIDTAHALPDRRGTTAAGGRGAACGRGGTGAGGGGGAVQGAMSGAHHSAIAAAHRTGMALPSYRYGAVMGAADGQMALQHARPATKQHLRHGREALVV